MPLSFTVMVRLVRSIILRFDSISVINVLNFANGEVTEKDIVMGMI
jgi:hypothetical protein